MGSMTGAPKISAMKIIEALEEFGYKPYVFSFEDTIEIMEMLYPGYIKDKFNDSDDKPIRKIISHKDFKSTWGDFVGDELKTAPKGFDKDHKAIDLLRFKQFIFTKNFSDEEVLSANFADKVDETFKAMRPFFDYMSDVLTTDINGESI